MNSLEENGNIDNFSKEIKVIKGSQMESIQLKITIMGKDDLLMDLTDMSCDGPIHHSFI